MKYYIFFGFLALANGRMMMKMIPNWFKYHEDFDRCIKYSCPFVFLSHGFCDRMFDSLYTCRSKVYGNMLHKSIFRIYPMAIYQKLYNTFENSK